MVQFLARMVVPAKMENASVRLSTEELSVMEVSSCCCSIVRFVVFCYCYFCYLHQIISTPNEKHPNAVGDFRVAFLPCFKASPSA